jgi:hypothetical protein
MLPTSREKTERAPIGDESDTKYHERNSNGTIKVPSASSNFKVQDAEAQAQRLDRIENIVLDGMSL